MRKSKFYTIIIAVAFLLAICFSCVCLLMVKKIDITYTVVEDMGVFSFDEDINSKFKGKLLPFISEDKVESAVFENPYFSFKGLDKHFPNSVKLKVEMRRETYLLQIEENYYILDKDGFVLSKNSEKKQSFDLINLQTTNIDYSEIELGKKIKSNCDKLLNNVFEMAKSVKLSDNISVVSVDSLSFDIVSVVFLTRTGVEIEVVDSFNNSIEKITRAFNVYDEIADDYSKTHSKILVYTDMESEEIKIDWTERG